MSPFIVVLQCFLSKSLVSARVQEIVRKTEKFGYSIPPWIWNGVTNLTLESLKSVYQYIWQVYIWQVYIFKSSSDQNSLQSTFEIVKRKNYHKHPKSPPSVPLISESPILELAYHSTNDLVLSATFSENICSFKKPFQWNIII